MTPASMASPEAATATRTIEVAVDLPYSPAAIWHCLTDEVELGRWFCEEAAVEPGVGGVIEARWPGGFVSAEPIVAWEPERLLATRWEDPHDPESALDVSWTLERTRKGTRLAVTHEGFAHDAAADGLFDGCERGWRFQLATLAHYLEHHRGRDRSMVFLGQPTLMDRKTAWAALAKGLGFAGVTARSRRATLSCSGDAAIQGQLLWCDPPRDLVLVWPEGGDALVRVQVDLPMGEGTPHVVYLFVSRWGGEPSELEVIEQQWLRLLQEALPR